NQTGGDAGGWVKLPAKQLTVKVPPATRSAVGRVVLPFRVTVPANASPGDHGAALVAVLSTLGKNPKGENVRLDQRLASRIYLRVNGPLHPGLRVEGLSVSYHRSLNPAGSGSATVRYTVRNVGNVRLAATGQKVSVTGLLGTRATATPPDLPLLFPGASTVVTIRLPGVRPTVLEKARVSLKPQLSPDQKPMALTAVAATASFLAIPWSTIGCLLVLILLAVLAIRQYLALRRRPRGGRHGARRTGGDPAPRPRPASQTPETIRP
ncbi:MAG: hypothetical protein JO144_13195, partial [Actinobacteria bacterium]|nr:hypothetical protein [Actinomycetota bacterium]